MLEWTAIHLCPRIPGQQYIITAKINERWVFACPYWIKVASGCWGWGYVNKSDSNRVEWDPTHWAPIKNDPDHMVTEDIVDTMLEHQS